MQHCSLQQLIVCLSYQSCLPLHELKAESLTDKSPPKIIFQLKICSSFLNVILYRQFLSYVHMYRMCASQVCAAAAHINVAQSSTASSLRTVSTLPYGPGWNFLLNFPHYLSTSYSNSFHFLEKWNHAKKKSNWKEDTPGLPQNCCFSAPYILSIPKLKKIKYLICVYR